MIPHGVEIVYLIPTLNEAPTVGEVVRRAKRYARRVVVVDGYSGDDTCDRAEEAGAEILLQKGKGKGAALHTAFSSIDADIYVIVDGDGTYDVGETEELLAPILMGEARMAIGSRLSGKLEDGAISKTHLLGNRFFNYLINVLFRSDVTDSQSGFRVISRDAMDLQGLRSKGFEIETEMTIQALGKGVKVVEVPIAYGRRTGSPSKLNGFRHGFSILITILRIWTASQLGNYALTMNGSRQKQLPHSEEVAFPT